MKEKKSESQLCKEFSHALKSISENLSSLHIAMMENKGKFTEAADSKEATSKEAELLIHSGKAYEPYLEKLGGLISRMQSVRLVEGNDLQALKIQAANLRGALMQAEQPRFISNVKATKKCFEDATRDLKSEVDGRQEAYAGALSYIVQHRESLLAKGLEGLVNREESGEANKFNLFKDLSLDDSKELFSGLKSLDELQELTSVLAKGDWRAFAEIAPVPYEGCESTSSTLCIPGEVPETTPASYEGCESPSFVLGDSREAPEVPLG